jgi:hypothetical protein
MVSVLRASPDEYRGLAPSQPRYRCQNSEPEYYGTARQTFFPLASLSVPVTSAVIAQVSRECRPWPSARRGRGRGQSSLPAGAGSVEVIFLQHGLSARVLSNVYTFRMRHHACCTPLPNFDDLEYRNEASRSIVHGYGVMLRRFGPIYQGLRCYVLRDEHRRSFPRSARNCFSRRLQIAG